MKKAIIKWKNIVLLVIIVICTILLLISLINIINWKKDSNNTEDIVKDIESIVEVDEVVNSDNVEIINQEEEIPKSDPYWDYIKMNLINVDFSELKGVNNQTKGWIQVGGTNINYPVVQSKDNEYYLTRSFDKTYNDAGWIFLDYRNNFNDLDRNTIIYGHSRLDKTMFGTLKNILKSDWIKNTDNYIVKLSTETENTLWQVFSVYKIPTTNDYLKINFSSDNDFKEFTNMILKRSDYNFNTKVSDKDYILTLSTCADNDKKVVLHAKLIKKEKR